MRGDGLLPRLPLVGGLAAAAGGVVEAVVAVPRAITGRVAALPSALIHAVLDEVFGYVAGTDLTPVLLRAVDLDRVLRSVDLDALLRGVDLNAVLDGVDLDALLRGVDLNALLDGVDLNPLLARLDLNPVLSGLDLNPLLTSLDLTTVVGGIDLNAVLAGVDIDAVLARTDLVGVAATVVDGIDLNSIVRDASASVTTEMIGDVRTGSERADDRVEIFVNRLLRRTGDGPGEDRQ